MYIGKNKLSPKIIEKLPTKAVIIDNDKRILEDCLEKIDIVPIWFTQSVRGSQNMKKITSLDQIENILKD